MANHFRAPGLDDARDDWPDEAINDSIMDGDLLPAFQQFLDAGAHLAVLPVARLHVESPVAFPGGIAFYPPGEVDFDQMNVVPNRSDTTSLAEHSSAASGITQDVLERHPLVVFSCRFDWRAFRSAGHRTHLAFIRRLSEEVDLRCLNCVRFRSCRLEPIDDLPAHAGQVASNHMMAGALLYNGQMKESRIVGGAAFTHYLTRGLGLPLDHLGWGDFPRVGETGRVANHALSLYASLLESDNQTARFMQALSLLEFLASPDEYQRFEKEGEQGHRPLRRPRCCGVSADAHAVP
jgi:hypothetical protein